MLFRRKPSISVYINSPRTFNSKQNLFKHQKKHTPLKNPARKTSSTESRTHAKIIPRIFPRRASHNTRKTRQEKSRYYTTESRILTLDLFDNATREQLKSSYGDMADISNCEQPADGRTDYKIKWGKIREKSPTKGVHRPWIFPGISHPVPSSFTCLAFTSFRRRNTGILEYRVHLPTTLQCFT